MKNQQLLIHHNNSTFIREVRSQDQSCPQNWRDRLADIENQNLSEHKPMSWNLYKKQCRGRETWTVTNKFLVAQYEQVWEL